MKLYEKVKPVFWFPSKHQVWTRHSIHWYVISKYLENFAFVLSQPAVILFLIYAHVQGLL